MFLTQPLCGLVLLNREPTVAVAAARKAIGNQGDGDAGLPPLADILDTILSGTR